MKFILSCLLLPTTGSREELVDRLINYDVEVGRKFYVRGSEIKEHENGRIEYTISDKWPTYILKTLLKIKGLESTGNKEELLNRLRDNGITSEPVDPSDNTIDKEIIASFVEEVMKRGKITNPSIKHQYALAEFGYYYVDYLKNFIHEGTWDKLYGKISLQEYMYLFIHSPAVFKVNEPTDERDRKLKNKKD